MTISQADICGMNFHYFRHSFDRFLDDAEALQLPLVEIWGAAPHFYLGDRTLADARALGASVSQRGMKIACFTPEQCVYPINLGSPQAALRDRSIRYFLESLEMSVEMGSPAVLVTPGSGFADQSAKDAFDRCADALGLIADRADKLGQKLFLEALPPAWSNIAATARELGALLDAVGSKVMFGMLDTAGALGTRESVKDYISVLGDRLAHVHMIDSEPSGSHLAWGDGVLSAGEIIAELNASGYNGALSIEITNARYYLDPKAALAQSVTALRNVLPAS